MNSRVKFISLEIKLIPKVIVKGKRHESQRENSYLEARRREKA